MNVEIKLVLIVLGFIQKTTAQLFEKIYNKSDIVDVLSISILNHFSSRSTIIYVHNDEMKLKDTAELDDDAVMKLIQDLNPKKAVALISIDIFGKRERIFPAKHINVFFNLKTCGQLLNVAKFTFVDTVGYVIALITQDTLQNCWKMIRENNEYFQTQNLTVIVPQEEHSEVITTITILTSSLDKKLSRIQAIAVISNKLESTRHQLMHPKKHSRNRPLHVGFIENYPHAMIQNKEEPSTLEEIKNVVGADVEAIKIIAASLNMSLRLHFLKHFGDNKDEKYANKTIIKNFALGKLEIAVGGLHILKGHSDYVEYSGNYNQIETFWVYSNTDNSRSWEKLLERAHGFYFFVIFYFVFSFTRYWLNFYQNIKKRPTISDIFFHNWGALIGCSSPPKPQTQWERILAIFYWMLCLHCQAYLAVQLFSYLTVTPPPRKFTNDELMDSGKIPYIRPQLKYLTEDESYLEFVKNSKYCDDFLDCVNRVIQNDGATILGANTYELLQAQLGTGAGFARLIKVPENILTSNHEMFVRRGSPITIQFRIALKRLLEAGIFDELLKRAKGPTLGSKAHDLSEKTSKNGYTCMGGCPITFVQTAGLFYLLSAGWIVSFSVFIVEFCYNWYKYKRQSEK